MRVAIATLGLVLMASAASAGDVLKANSPFCATLGQLKALEHASKRSDMEGLRFLVENGKCAMFNAPIKASLLDELPTSGYAKVRLYIEDQTAEGWTLRVGVVPE